MKKEQIIFLHIPKTAGTTLRNIVYAQHGETKVAPIYQDKWYIEIKEFSQLSDERKNQANVIMGHFFYGFHNKLSGNRPYRYATMLRNPIARCLSLYNHLNNKQAHNSLSLQELLKTPTGSQFINGQSSLISGSHGFNFQKKSTELLKQALKNIESHFAFVGLTERFNESMLLAHHQLGWKLQPYETRNTAKQWPVNYAEELKNDKEAMDLLAELNQTDMLLYEYVETRFTDLLNEMYPDLQDRLSQFEESLGKQSTTAKGIGNLGKLQESKIVGWAKLLHNDNPAKVGININDGEEMVANAVIRREDLIHLHYTGRCGFALKLSQGVRLKQGDRVSAYIINADNTPLNHSPRIFGENEQA